MTENKKQDTNIVYVGQKPLANYVTAVLTQLHMSGSVVIKARGRAMSRAIDAAEVVRNKFGSLEIENVAIGSENLVDKENGRTTTLSFIEIYGRQKEPKN